MSVEGLADQIKKLQTRPGQGVFMEIIETSLKQKGIEIPFLAADGAG